MWSSRTQARSLREWHLGSEKVRKADEVHHLGILWSVSFSTLSCTAERSTTGRSAFFALNAVGSRFSCLHPITSYKLYSTLSIPIGMLYGSELWSLTNTELNFLECTYHTIPSKASPSDVQQQPEPDWFLFDFILYLPTTTGFHKLHCQHAWKPVTSPSSCLKPESETPELKESLSPGETFLTSSASPLSNSFLVHPTKRDLETINQTAPEHPSIHQYARSVWEISPRWLCFTDWKTCPTLDRHPPRHPCNPQEQLSDLPSSRMRGARSKCQSFPMEERSQWT